MERHPAWKTVARLTLFVALLLLPSLVRTV